MRWFGPSWGAYLCLEGEESPVPVDAHCLDCGDGFAPLDRGIWVGIAAGEAPMHWECFVRGVVGSVGHQLKRCPCFGGMEEDPPGLTRHEAAKAACVYFMATQVLQESEEAMKWLQ